ncbi:MAG: hypothetical protein M1829_003936 [Trizodia sp. TS-e1964]|nr:MAG: hypothetical protein M1829_003936 [Trizodia sp. TS-e1964]
MKILTPQSAILTNHEVLTHIQSIRPPNPPHPLPMKSPNLETILKELSDYLLTPPSPLAPPSRYDASTIRKLVVALSAYELTKPELLMILNLRPQSVAMLDALVEEFEIRFGEREQAEMLERILDVLGREEG